jgi:hypothetical protein
MKYAKEVLDLIAAYPGRGFKMREIVRYVSPQVIGRERHAVRRGVLRVIDELVACGSVDRYPPHAVRGESTMYTWKVRHGNLDCATETATIEPERLRPHETQSLAPVAG